MRGSLNHELTWVDRHSSFFHHAELVLECYMGTSELQALIRIAQNLVGIAPADLSTAESNIMGILVEQQIVRREGGKYKLEKWFKHEQLSITPLTPSPPICRCSSGHPMETDSKGHHPLCPLFNDPNLPFIQQI
jgi:hypothetical protein